MAYEVSRGHPARPRRRMRAFLVLVATGLFLCCVGAAGLGAWNFQHINRAAGPARRAAEGFWRQVVAGDTAAAYDKLCPDTRDRFSREEFTQRLSVPPTISAYRVEKVSVATDGDRLRGTVTVRLTRHSGAMDLRRMPMLRDDADWQVCGDPY